MQRNGIHHVTAISGAAQRNFDFYTRVLGLRLVKKTVNFDDPGTYHLYYGDETGQPGTILTFFPWEHMAPGRLGTGELQETMFRVPEGAIGFWVQRLVTHNVAHETPTRRLGEGVLTFRDPDGMRLALVAVTGADAEPAWTGAGDIPAKYAIRGFHGVSLLLAESAGTAAVLTDVLGFAEAASEGSVTRYRSADTALGGIVDLHTVGGFPRGRMGVGSVHHLAFRAENDAAQAAMVRKLAENHGIPATDQKNRDYFRAVYFREPGGLLFEIATDDPGFAVDEPLATLGQVLKLPRGLESRRARIEGVLPPLVQTESAI